MRKPLWSSKTRPTAGLDSLTREDSGLTGSMGLQQEQHCEGKGKAAARMAHSRGEETSCYISLPSLGFLTQKLRLALFESNKKFPIMIQWILDFFFL